MMAPIQQNLIRRELGKIYAPIQPDLARVEGMLKSAGSGDIFPLVEGLSCNLKDSEAITHLLTYSLEGQGKRLRPALTLLSGKFYGYNLEHLLMMATAIEVLHTATLVHDDIIDKAALRRGKPTLNVMSDNDRALLSGDYLLAKAVELITNTQNLRVIKLFVKTVLIICGGELTQNFNLFNPEQTREQYLTRIVSKTASLLSLAAESGAILSQAPESAVRALRNYGYYLGIAFQIADDILDFVGDEEELGKPVGSDLTEGVLTLPAIMLLERHPYGNSIAELLRRSDKKENVAQVVQLIREDPSIIEECYSIASDYAAKACRELKSLPSNASRKSLDSLARYVVSRRK